MTIAKIKRQMKLELEDDTYSIKLVNNIPGTAKTTAAIEYCLDMNKNNVIYFDNHRLTWDFSTDILTPSDIKLKHKLNVVNMFYGKFKKLTEIEQIVYGWKNTYLCNLSVLDDIFKCLRVGFCPVDYCSNYCPFSVSCDYKKLINDNMINAKNVQTSSDINVLNIMTKAHVHTELNKKMFSMFDKMNVVMDENFFNLLYTQIDLNASSLEKYKKLILSTITYDPSLHDLWIDYSAIIDKMINFLKGFGSYKVELKKKHLKKEFIEFLSSYEIEDLEQWNKLMSLTIINNIGSFKLNTLNLTNNFLDIFKELKKTKDKEKLFDDSTVLDIDDQKFSFVINNRQNMLNLIEMSNNFIVTSSLLDGEIFECLFPTLKGKYKVIHDKHIKPKFKEVWRLKRAQYPKYVLWRKNKPTESFVNLIKITSDILQKHGPGECYLIIGFKAYINNEYTHMNYIEAHLKRYIKDYSKYNIQYEYWYNIEGLNRYSDIDIEIQFGSPGVPKAYVESVSGILNISTDIMDKIMVFGAQIQAAERLRSIKSPYEKIIYQLCKNVNGYYNKYISFTNIIERKYIDLVRFIRKAGMCETTHIIDKYYSGKMSYSNVNRILNLLKKNGILTKMSKSTEYGRPKTLWKIK